MVPAAVIRHLSQMVAEGQLSVGDRLPGERELAQTLGVSRNGVREALKILELAGSIEVRAGSGSYLRDDTGILVDYLLSRGISQDLNSVRQLLDVRRTVEARVAELAAMNAGAEDIAAMEAVLARMERGVADHTLELGALDTQFHMAVAQASGNTLYVDIVRRCLAALARMRQRLLFTFGQDNLQRTLREHRTLLTFLQNGDSSGAKECMIQHLDHVEQQMISFLQGGERSRGGGERRAVSDPQPGR